MDRPSILGQKSAPSPPNISAAPRSATASVSAGIAAANAHLSPPPEPAPTTPEGIRNSLAEMAHRDLDAALQLLVERAQYITDAAGAAIALRRGDHNDMLCRASSGSSAPELGALISMEYGLSGESVRTRQTLRCDDAEHDPRVNREGCRQLGIASVVVMPIVSNDQVLGVFQLFSGRPRTFADRDISALRRLGEMVATAVNYALAAQSVPEASPQLILQLDEESARQSLHASQVVSPPVEKQMSAPFTAPAEAAPKVLQTEKPEESISSPEASPKKPLFWSAAVQTQNASSLAESSSNSIAVPAGLRNLQKCQSCGFPVSQGRTFCVECEEKQWRGQRLQVPDKEALSVASVPATVREPASSAATPKAAGPSDAMPDISPTLPPIPAPNESAEPEAKTKAEKDKEDDNDKNKNKPVQDTPALFSSSAVTTESWFYTNKYVLGVLAVVAIVIGVIVWLR